MTRLAVSDRRVLGALTLVWLVAMLMMPVLAPAQGDNVLARSYELLPAAGPRVRSYTTLRYIVFFAGTLWSLIGFWLIVKLRLGRTVLDGVRRYRRLRTLSPAAVWCVVAILMAFWMLPVSAASLRIERGYGFSTMGNGLWLADRARDLALSLLWAPLLVPALWIVGRSPRWWWAWVSLVLVPVALFMVVIYPVAVDPVYNSYTPLAEGSLRSRLLALASKAGAGSPDVLVMDTSKRTRKLNAYVTGIGPTKRIVLWDNLLKSMDEDMVAAVTAHELGHYVLHHIWWGFALQTLGGALTLWLLSISLRGLVRLRGERLAIRGISDPAVIPLAALVLQVLLVAQTPAAAIVSRTMERQADAYGLRLNGDGDSMARALAAFGTRDYADPDPPRWIVYWCYTHPPLRERVVEALRHGRHTDPEGARVGSHRSTISNTPVSVDRRAARVNWMTGAASSGGAGFGAPSRIMRMNSASDPSPGSDGSMASGTRSVHHWARKFSTHKSRSAQWMFTCSRQA